MKSVPINELSQFIFDNVMRDYLRKKSGIESDVYEVDWNAKGYSYPSWNYIKKAIDPLVNSGKVKHKFIEKGSFKAHYYRKA